MALEDSYKELYKRLHYTPKNFHIGRNVPIDNRFLLENLSELNSKIPLQNRYPGLVFFVKDQEINDGTTVNKTGASSSIGLGPQDTKNKGHVKFTGVFYVFNDDLNTPIPMHDLVERFDIRLLNITDTTDNAYKYLCDGDDNNLLSSTNANDTNCLNHLYSKVGDIVFIQPLNIAVICTNNNGKPKWKYFAGTYSVTTEAQFNNIPNSLKQINGVVNVANPKATKIINSQLQLTSEILETNSPSDCTENGRFYNINGFIYYHFADITIPVSNKFVTKIQSLNVGENRIELSPNNIAGDSIQHTIFDSEFNTKNIIVDCIILNHEQNPEYNGHRFPVENILIKSGTDNDFESNTTVDSIIIKSSIRIDKVLLIIRADI